MDFDKRFAARVTAHLMADGPVHDVAKRIDPHSALLTIKIVTGFGAYLLGEQAHEMHTTLEAILHQSEAPEPGHRQAADTHSEQVKDEQAKAAEQEKAEQLEAVEQDKAEQVKAVEQEKAERVKADAELADKAEKSAAEIDALKKDFAREQQDLEGKLKGLADNYFSKYPGLSEDQRDEANKTFDAVKEEALGNLRGQQEARLEELTRAQQQREGLEERRKEPAGARDRS